MQWIIETYLKDSTGRVLDVGSRDVQKGKGTYRHLFNNTRLEYRGCDITAGDNVDLIMPGPYEIPSQWGKFEAIISGQVIEHVEDIYKWLKSLHDALKPQGHLVIISPCSHGIHRHPVDCWRILPDGYKWLFGQFLGMEVLYADLREGDVLGVAKLK